MIGGHLKPIAAYAAAKGAIVAGVMHALDVGFLKSLAVAVVSGGIGAAGAVVAARVAVRETRRVQKEVRDVKRAVGADKRATDKPEEE